MTDTPTEPDEAGEPETEELTSEEMDELAAVGPTEQADLYGLDDDDVGEYMDGQIAKLDAHDNDLYGLDEDGAAMSLEIRGIVATAATIPEGAELEAVTMRFGIDMLKGFRVFTEFNISTAEVGYSTANFMVLANAIGKREGVPAAMIAYLMQETALQELQLLAVAEQEAAAAEVAFPEGDVVDVTSTEEVVV